MPHITHITFYAFVLNVVLMTNAHAQTKGQAIQQNGFKFQLVPTAEGHLSLHGQHIKSGRQAEWNLDKFDPPHGYVIKQHVLASRLDTGVMAVVVLKSKKDYKAYSLMFATADESDLRNKTIPVHAREIHSSDSPFDILAVNGSFQGDGIVVVLGNLDRPGAYREVRSAVVLLDDCPVINVDAQLKSVLTRQPAE